MIPISASVQDLFLIYSLQISMYKMINQLNIYILKVIIVEDLTPRGDFTPARRPSFN